MTVVMKLEQVSPLSVLASSEVVQVKIGRFASFTNLTGFAHAVTASGGMLTKT